MTQPQRPAAKFDDSKFIVIDYTTLTPGDLVIYNRRRRELADPLASTHPSELTTAIVICVQYSESDPRYKTVTVFANSQLEFEELLFIKSWERPEFAWCQRIELT